MKSAKQVPPSGADHDKQAELRLVAELSAGAEQSIFEQLVNHFPDIIHSVDRQGLIVSTNKRATEILGYSKAELIGMPVEQIYAPAVRKLVQAGFKELKETGWKSVQSQIQCRDGSIRDVEIRSLSLYDESGEFVKTFSIIRDISDINSLKLQLAQSGKMAAIGELSSGILHDLRNPVAIIQNYLELLPRFVESGDRTNIQKAGDAMTRATQRIRKLLDHMRLFIRGERENPEPVVLADVVKDSLFMLENGVRNKGIRISNQVQSPDLVVPGIYNQLEQVLVNIIGNAVDAFTSEEERLIEIRATSMDGHIHISVRDTGPGMSEAIAAQVFDSFFTTKEKGNGTGLGLAISKGIIADHKGSIAVTSSIGQGTTFTISLPVS